MDHHGTSKGHLIPKVPAGLERCALRDSPHSPALRPVGIAQASSLSFHNKVMAILHKPGPRGLWRDTIRVLKSEPNHGVKTGTAQLDFTLADVPFARANRHFKPIQQVRGRQAVDPRGLCPDHGSEQAEGTDDSATGSHVQLLPCPPIGVNAPEGAAMARPAFCGHALWALDQCCDLPYPTPVWHLMIPGALLCCGPVILSFFGLRIATMARHTKRNGRPDLWRALRRTR